MSTFVPVFEYNTNHLLTLNARVIVNLQPSTSKTGGTKEEAAPRTRSRAPWEEGERKTC